MSRAINRIQKQAFALKENPMLIIDKEFVIGVMELFRNKLPLLQDFYDYHYEKKKQQRIGKSGERVLPEKLLLDKLFNPTHLINIKSDNEMKPLSETLADTIMQEFTDKRKEIHDHSSFIKGKYSWALTTEAKKKLGLGLLANNNVSESLFGGATHNADAFKMINLRNADGMPLNRFNETCSRPITYAQRRIKAFMQSHSTQLLTLCFLQMNYHSGKEFCTR